MKNMISQFKNIFHKIKAFYDMYYLLALLYFALSWLFGLKPAYCFALFLTVLIILEVLLYGSYLRLKRDFIDRLFILSIIFVPLIFTQYLFLYHRTSGDNNFWTYYKYYVPHFFNADGFQWMPIFYLITIGVFAYLIEKFRENLRRQIQWLTRFAPAVVAIIFIIMSCSCYWLIYLQEKRTPDFSMYEFGSPGDLEKLCDLVNCKKNRIPSPSLENLNNFLCTPDFYESVKDDKPGFVFSESINNLVKERGKYAPRTIGPDKVTIINKKLNRLILEEAYHNNTPQSLSSDCFVKNAVWLFCMIFFGFCPVFCFIPVIVIISKITTAEKTNQAANLKSCFFKFYKIFFIETPVTISCGCFFLILGIASVLTNVPPAISKEVEITMWQLGFELSKLFTPIILLITPLSVAIRDFDRLFVSDYHRRVCSIIATMRKHKILLGYGYLGREVLAELKERRIVDHHNVLDIITPTLQERKFYKDLLIVDKDRNVFNYVFDDPIYGTIGIIEPAPDGQSDSSALIIGIVGDHGMTTLERASINGVSLFISAIPDYDATNTLIKVLSDKKYKCSCIVTIQDDHQFKLQLPYIYKKAADSKSMILLYPSYLEGVELGRTVLLAAKKWQENESLEKPLPKIMICGSGKQIYYIIQTYLFGLQQLSSKSIKELGPLNISILSDEKFYVENINVGERCLNSTAIKCGTLNESFVLPDGSKVPLELEFYNSDPRDKKNIDSILRGNTELRPDIIVISHKKAWDVLRILHSWNDVLCSMEEVYKPPILVGNKGEDARVIDCLKNYAKKRNINDTSFPIQDHDASVGIYRDARGLIASIAESLTGEQDRNRAPAKDINSLSLHYYASIQDDPLSYLCNKLSGLVKDPADVITARKLTFTNTRVYNCPGYSNWDKQRNYRFILESDVVIKELLEDRKEPNENVICKGLIMTKCRKKTVEGLIGKERNCFNQYCDLRELCDDTINLHISTSNGSESTAIARLSVCSDFYNDPGSVANTLNSLMLAIAKPSETPKMTGAVINLTGIRSYYCTDPRTSRIELYGNEKKINNDEYVQWKKKFDSSNISYVSISPVTNKKAWFKYGKKLLSFLNNTLPNGASYTLEPTDTNNHIEITKRTHECKCPKTCNMAKRKEHVKRLCP